MTLNIGDDFTNFPLADWGVTVVRNAVTKTTDNITGDESLAYGANTNVTAIILRKQTKWMFDKDGLIEGGDAYLMVPGGTTVAKDDKITYGGVVYLIQDVIARGPPGSDAVYIYCNLFVSEV